jgi:very-short-patch-repair endonuclease
MATDRTARAERRTRVARHAAAQAGLLTRPQIRQLGLTAAQLEAELRAGRWQPLGRHTVAVRPPRPGDQVVWWLSVLERAPRGAAGCRPRAALAGLTALLAAGLSGIADDGLVHVAAPKSSHPVPPPAVGVRVHETRRWRDEDIVATGIPRALPEVAAVQGALWARSDREAALLLVATVQQRLAPVDAVAAVVDRIQRDKRRGLIRAVLVEIAGGVHSLNELDFAALCRARGLPDPDRQVVVRSPQGSSYLDVRWRRWRVVVEIDGIGHLEPARWIDDSLRHNEIALSGDTVLRIPSLGLRLDPSRHLDAVERALRQSGWTPHPPTR